MAAEWGKTECLGEMWEWATVELSTEELNNKLLLAKYDRKQTVCHYASVWDTVQLLGKYGKGLKSN